MLSAKSQTSDLFSAQRGPQFEFGVGVVGAEVSRSLNPTPPPLRLAIARRVAPSHKGRGENTAWSLSPDHESTIAACHRATVPSPCQSVAAHFPRQREWDLSSAPPREFPKKIVLTYRKIVLYQPYDPESNRERFDMARSIRSPANLGTTPGHAEILSQTILLSKKARASNRAPFGRLSR
jgi:hypothetical protein